MRRVEGRPLASFIIREFVAFVHCGDVTHAWAELGCTRSSCSYKRTIPLCCKRRGWCTYCGERRLWDRSAFLEHHVLGDTPVRHWVDTLPPPLRFNLAVDPSLVTTALKCHTEAIFRHLRWKAKRVLKLESTKHAHPGAVTTIQRFSSNLDLNVHFHSLVTDGVFVQTTPDGPVTFHQLAPPTSAEIAAVAWDTCRRVCNALRRRGLWRDLPDPEKPASRPTIYGSIKTRDGWRTVRFCGAAASYEAEHPVIRDGAQAFNIYAGQGVRGGDRKKLAKVTRYILNPPFTDAQLTEDADGNIHYEHKRPRFDGTHTRVFTKMQLMEKLVLQTPRPHANLIRFHGVYASNSELRPACVPAPPKPVDEEQARGPNGDEDFLAWAEFRTRTHPEDASRCPRCRSRLRLVALTTERRRYRRSSGIPPDWRSADNDRTAAD
jgi:hypothetical protein